MTTDAKILNRLLAIWTQQHWMVRQHDQAGFFLGKQENAQISNCSLTPNSRQMSSDHFSRWWETFNKANTGSNQGRTEELLFNTVLEVLAIAIGWQRNGVYKEKSSKFSCPYTHILYFFIKLNRKQNNLNMQIKNKT